MANRVLTAGIAVIPPLFIFNADDSINRTIRFYSVAVPAYLHYELMDRVHSKSDISTREQVFNKLHDRYSPIMRDNVLRMRGFFLKAAQLMSIRDDYLPPQYLEWTTQMQNEAPITFSSEEAKKIICDELKIKSISDIFSEFQDQSVGSASIGQVYRARLRESGKLVAVKVQSAGVEGQFRADLKCCKTFCQFALPHLVVPLEEIERQFMTEFDYSLEAKNLEERVLVMEFIEGKKVSDIFHQYIAELAEKQKKSPAEVKNELKSWILKQGLTNLSEHRWHHRFVTWAHWVGRVVTLGIYSAGKSDPSVNPVDLLDTAMRAHAHQIFVNRAFNGDPHPGNLMLTPDGKLGLIDFGQVKRLSPDRVEQFSRLVLALNDDDRDKICEIAKEIGCSNRQNIPDVVYRLTAFWMDRDTPDITLGLDIHKFLEEMERRDPQKELCQDLVMVSRCSVMLRSLGLSLGMRVRTSDYWRSYAEAYLAKYNSNFTVIMLEVLLASIGSGIAGAARGYAASVNSKQPARIFLGSTLVAAIALNEANRFKERRKETRAHIPGASAQLMDDTIIESSPTYLVDNSPLFVGIFAAAFTIVGGLSVVSKRSIPNIFRKSNAVIRK